MRPITVSVGPLTTLSANSIALSQTVPTAGRLTLNGAAVAGGVAVFSPPAQVTITSAGNDSGIFWTISGLATNGLPMGEQLTGANVGAVSSQFTYSQVYSITASGPAASTVTAGNSTSAASQPIRFDDWADAPLGVQVSVSGTVNYTVQHSFDNPNDLINPIPVASMFWDTGLIPAGAIGSTTGVTFSMATAPLYMRLLLNSGTGSARMVCTQFNVVEG